MNITLGIAQSLDFVHCPLLKMKIKTQKNPCSRVHFEKLIVACMVKKFPPRMEPECLLPYSRKSAASPCLQTNYPVHAPSSLFICYVIYLFILFVYLHYLFTCLLISLLFIYVSFIYSLIYQSLIHLSLMYLFTVNLITMPAPYTAQYSVD
jgi:hypothetical protein